MNPIKTKRPSRNCNKRYTNYRDYKPYLSKDFHERCGYCDTPSQRIGGYKSMHIDHFVPWKKFARTHKYLYTDYNNLVYACPYCNGSKSDDWPTENPLIHNNGKVGYVNPYDKEFMEIFKRMKSGEILALRPVAEYMHYKLCLGLRRHKIIWQLEKLYNLFHEIDELIENPQLKMSTKEALIDYRNNIGVRYMRIEKQFREIIS
jgi:hypothetical protein